MIADLEQSSPESILKPRKRKITLSDVKQLADLVARGHLETEACHLCEINPKQWFVWKNRNKASERFDILLASMKAKRISNNLAQIDKAATGTGGVRHDWRAADRLNAIIAPERFAQNRDNASLDTAKAALLTADTMAKIAAQMLAERQAKQVTIEVSPAEVKQLPSCDK